MLDAFLINEEKGRKIFEEFLSQAKNTSNWNPTKNKYNPVDGFFKLDNKKIVGEIKTRDKQYMNYLTHLIQIDKYMNLTQAKVTNNCYTGLYVNIFGSDTIYIYDLKDINSNNCNITEMMANRHTAINSGKTKKQFYEIPTRFAQVFKKDENGKWHKITN